MGHILIPFTHTVHPRIKCTCIYMYVHVYPELMLDSYIMVYTCIYIDTIVDAIITLLHMYFLCVDAILLHGIRVDT